MHVEVLVVNLAECIVITSRVPIRKKEFGPRYDEIMMKYDEMMMKPMMKLMM